MIIVILRNRFCDRSEKRARVHDVTTVHAVRSTSVTLHQSHLVAVHTLQGDHFGGEVISVDGFLASVAHRTRQQPVAPADLARRTRVRALKNRQKKNC